MQRKEIMDRERERAAQRKRKKEKERIIANWVQYQAYCTIHRGKT